MPSYCDEALGAFTNSPCERYPGKARSLVFVLASEVEGLTLDNAATLDTEIQALADASPPTAWIIPRIKGDYPAPEASVADSYGDGGEIVVQMTHTLNILHNSIKENQAFWNAARLNTSMHCFWRVGDLGDTVNVPQLYHSGTTVNINVTPIIPAGETEESHVGGTVKWKSINNPLSYDSPTDIFTD